MALQLGKMATSDFNGHLSEQARENPVNASQISRGSKVQKNVARGHTSKDLMNAPTLQSQGQKAISSPTLNLKDQYGLPSSLSEQIHKKYELIAIVGKGSYGFVAKAMQRTTGRLVALKMMKSPVETEYEVIKLLRELQI